jgi:hypothetical protein
MAGLQMTEALLHTIITKGEATPLRLLCNNSHEKTKTDLVHHRLENLLQHQLNRMKRKRKKKERFQILLLHRV